MIRGNLMTMPTSQWQLSAFVSHNVLGIRNSMWILSLLSYGSSFVLFTIHTFSFRAFMALTNQSILLFCFGWVTGECSQRKTDRSRNFETYTKLPICTEMNLKKEKKLKTIEWKKRNTSTIRWKRYTHSNEFVGDPPTFFPLFFRAHARFSFFFCWYVCNERNDIQSVHDVRQKANESFYHQFLIAFRHSVWF